MAPISWLVQWDVDEGRDHLNYSEWDRPQEGEESAETVRDESMPPWSYLITHRDARLTDSEKTALAEGLAATLGDQGEGGGEDNDKDEDEREDSDDD